MWILLEYDRTLLEHAVDVCKVAGIAIEGISRDEQLTALDPTRVDLILVGARWKLQTVEQLRESGIVAPVILVTDTQDDEARTQATAMHCVDMVSYPLPVSYLRNWAKGTGVDDNTARETAASLSPLEEVLRDKPIRMGKKTYSKETASLSKEKQDITILRGRIIAIYGMCGGIGKTTVTTLMAHHLATRHFSVAVVELDPKGNLQDRYQVKSPITVDEWTKMPPSMDERMVRQALVLPKNEGFYFLPRGEETRNIDAGTVRRILYNIASYFDVVLVDCNSDDALISTSTTRDMAHRMLYVMTPEWDSFRGFVKEYEKLCAQKGVDAIQVLVNRCNKSGEHKKALRLLKEAQMPSVICIPEDKTLRLQAVSGQALTGGREVMKAVSQVSGQLGFDPVLTEVRRKKKGWFR